MKAFFVEYAHLVGNTVIGLLFGLSFFLLFINFYHYEEIRTTYTPKHDNGTDYDNLLTQVNSIKEDINTYSQNTYKGSEGVFDMLGFQSKIKVCLEKYEDEQFKQLMTKETYNINDVYELVKYYQNSVLNDCVVLQLYSISSPTDPSIKSERFKTVAPFVRSQTELLLSNGLGYLKSNIQNNNIFYFSNENSKTGVF